VGEKRTAFIIGALMVVALGLVGAWSVTSSSNAPAVLTELTDRAAIQNMIQLDEVSILTSQNYVGHRLRVIRGWLKNVSEKPVRMVEVKFTFTDYDGKPVQESVHRTFNPTQKPIDPGTQYRFDINFENLPSNWNYRIPITEVVKVGY
jgi:hypothetical protein